MVALYIDFTVIFLIERRTRVYARLKPPFERKGYYGINRQVRARVIHELSGLVSLVKDNSA